MAEESLLAQTLLALITNFNRRGIPYALAGGWAYSALVEPRATTDIDVLLLLEQPSRDRLQSLLSSLFDSTLIHPAAMVFHGVSIWRCVGVLKNQEVVIDILLADSEYLRTALSRRRRIRLGDVPVSILTLEDLILLKTLADRLQDQADLENIRLRQDELHVDWTYVEEWKAKLGLVR
ncbi:MAG: hypothetical protein LDL14_11485 [Nitrospira sp.]|nr:hypothetical protein [Nitrospira sp.]